MRRTLIAVISAAALLVGYGVADAYDRAPGVLTIDEAVTQQAPPAPETTPVLPAASTAAPVPTTAGLTTALEGDAEAPALGDSVGVVVRDALTGETLYSHDGDRPITPASTQKLLTAAAVAQTADLSRVMTTKVVAGAQPGQLVLVAAGDTMLARGEGDPTSVEGRAGLADLARQVAAAVPAKGEGSYSLRLDLTYAHGERYPPTWEMADVAAGYTQAVTMIGLAGQRPTPGEPSPTWPERQVLTALGKELTAAGLDVEVDTSTKQWQQPAPDSGEVLGAVDSAPLGDVLALALDESDNALTENVARQVAARHGAGTSTAQVSTWVQQTLRGAGIDLTGVTLTDNSGLSSGQKVPARVISDVIQLGITGSAQEMTSILAELPVAGLTGTLHNRFDTDDSRAAAGLARAKTGTLTGTSTLAGTTTTTDDRLLTYVILADEVPSTTGTLGARAVLDRMVADLTECGCR